MRTGSVKLAVLPLACTGSVTSHRGFVCLPDSQTMLSQPSNKPIRHAYVPPRSSLVGSAPGRAPQRRMAGDEVPGAGGTSLNDCLRMAKVVRATINIVVGPLMLAGDQFDGFNGPGWNVRAQNEQSSLLIGVEPRLHPL